MRAVLLAAIFALLAAPISGSTYGASTVSSYKQYCQAISEFSMPTLAARVSNVPKSKALALMNGMTDPKAIRMVKEVIDFAYSRSPKLGLTKMTNELFKACMNKELFVGS